MEVTQGVRLPAEAAAACYSRFESVVEGALGQMDALFVRAVWKDHRLNLYLSVETGADLKAVCPAAVQEAPGKRPADLLGHASHSFVIPPKVAPPESPANRYSLRQRARTPLPRPGGSRKPSGAFLLAAWPVPAEKNRAAPHLCGAVLSGCAGRRTGFRGFPRKGAAQRAVFFSSGASGLFSRFSSGISSLLMMVSICSSFFTSSLGKRLFTRWTTVLR